MLGSSWIGNLEGGLALLGDASLRGFIVLAGAWAACLLLRRSSASLRHWIWTFSLAALAALPFTFDFAPTLRLPSFLTVTGTPEMNAAVSRTAAVPRLDATDHRGRAGAGESRVTSAEARPEPADSPTVAASTAGRPAFPGAATPMVRAAANAARNPFPGWLLFAAWAAGFALFAARLIAGHVRLRAMARGARPIDVSGDLEDREAVRGVRFLQSTGETMPMTWGWRTPVVLVPASFGKWDAERRSMTLYHELAHVQRADWLTQTLANLVRAAYWFHPLVWLGLRRMQVEADRACDDIVLGQGVKASGYAGHLVSVAREFRMAGLRPWVAIAMALPSSLDQRVQYVLDGTIRRSGLGRWGRLVVALSVAVVVLAIPSIDAAGQAETAPSAKRNTPAAEARPARAVTRKPAKRPVRVSAPAGGSEWDTPQANEAPDTVFENDEQLAEENAAEALLWAQAQEQAEPEVALEEDLEGNVSPMKLDAAMAQLKQKIDMAGKRAAEIFNAEQRGPLKLSPDNFHPRPQLSPEALQTASAALRKALTSSDLNLRAQAAESMGQLGSTEQINLEALGTALTDGNSRVRRAAAESLGNLVAQDREMPPARAVEFLKPAIESTDVAVRQQAAEALRGLRGIEAINAAARLVDDESPRVKREAIESLGELLSESDAETARASLPVLQKALQSPDPSVRRQIVESLGGLRSIADEVVPILAKAVEDADPRVQKEAVEALGRISSRDEFGEVKFHMEQDYEWSHPVFADAQN